MDHHALSDRGDFLGHVRSASDDDPAGLVAEGSGENLFLVRDGTLITPSVSGSFLPGITRDAVLTLARDLGIPAREQPVPREMLYIADELFFTGTAAEITPIRSVDRIPVGDGRPGPVTRAQRISQGRSTRRCMNW